MVESLPPPSLDAVFRALADPTRRDMLQRLAGGDRTIGELAAPLRMSLPGPACGGGPSTAAATYAA
jgi:DNA-binding transcriptional ArsR family regulator